jgi:hypothetical protein
MEKDFIRWEIDIPPFFTEDKFKINTEFLQNTETLIWLRKNTKFEYIFKSILGSFNKKRNKPVGVFNEQTLQLFNSTVENLNYVLDWQLNLNRDYQYQRSDVKDFQEFMDLKYNTDSKGKVYPDVYSEFGADKDKGKKKEPMIGTKKKEELPQEMNFGEEPKKENPLPAQGEETPF